MKELSIFLILLIIAGAIYSISMYAYEVYKRRKMARLIRELKKLHEDDVIKDLNK